MSFMNEYQICTKILRSTGNITEDEKNQNHIYCKSGSATRYNKVVLTLWYITIIKNITSGNFNVKKERKSNIVHFYTSECI